MEKEETKKRRAIVDISIRNKSRMIRRVSG